MLATDCFNMYVGETERILREIFALAEKKKPCIIFFDEIDGLCSTRTDSTNRFYNSIVTTMLGLMDNVPRGEVFVIAATNRLESIDPAMRRPGRFDKAIAFQLPKEGNIHFPSQYLINDHNYVDDHLDHDLH